MRLAYFVERGLYLAIISILIGSTRADAPDMTELYNQLAGRTSAIQFSYSGWMGSAILGKVGQDIAGVHDYLTEEQRSAYVREYLTWVARLQTFDAQIAGVYADSKTQNPDVQSADLRKQRDAARAEVSRRESLAESIAETQVAAVLRDEGFDTLGQIIPPVSARITQLPALLVVSSRSAIKVEASINVITISVDQATVLEDSIDQALNVSSLIVPLGGLSLFPSMVIQTWHTHTLFEVIAHEWCHHYLYFFPLGLSYDNAEARILNESTAVLFGREIARKTIERYYGQYPEIIRQLPLPITPAPEKTPAPTPDGPPKFDYDAAMNETRITVDSLLAAGKVSKAEAYMKVRRALFNANGIALRKLNQAYFAFYGGYQGVGGSGAGGTDPIGPALARLRIKTPTVRTWLEQMRGILTRADLLRAAE